MTQLTSSYGYRVRVAVPTPLYQSFDYLISADDFARAVRGARVLVPFGRQKLVAIILEKIPNDVAPTGNFKLKNILQLLDDTAILDEATLQLLLWTASYYQYPVGEVLHLGLPTLLRQGKSLNHVQRLWRCIALQDVKAPKLSLAQHEAYRLLQEHSDGLNEATLHTHGILNVTLNALAKKGIIECVEHHNTTPPATLQLAQDELIANAEQQQAIQQILQHQHHYRGFLLDGLTGSGKTEVYLQVMYRILQQGKQVLVLVPEIGLTPQTIARFQSRFHAPMVILHSALNDQKRLNAWRDAQQGQAAIILGTRSAVFTPMPHLGLIIVDEEHDLSYKQQETLRYHARDVALYRAYKQQCPIILGSATPSSESYHLVEQGKLIALQLTQRAGQAALPQLHTIDLTTTKKKHGFALPLIQKIEHALQQQEQVMIFLNRRGYAPVLLCESCAWQADCPRCDAHFTLHTQKFPHLHCHHCGLIQNIPPSCPSCQKPNTLKPIGMGTAKVEQHLHELFPNYPVLRIDRDSTNKVNAWQDIYQQVHQNQPLILLGTQMLAKGHHFPNVTLVVILDVDAGFFSVDFRAPERTAQQIVQVAGRAGRLHKQGHVYLQTHRPDHPLLQILLKHDYRHFALHDLQERKIAKFPPYRFAALIRVSSKSAEYNQQFLQQCVALLPAQMAHAPINVNVWGPIPAPMARKSGYFLAHLLLFAEHRQGFHHYLAIWWQQVLQLPRQSSLRISLDIDPQELS